MLLFNMFSKGLAGYEKGVIEINTAEGLLA